MSSTTEHQKDWWAPVWRGLVVDPEGKHYRRLKNSVWLFLYLLLHADRRGGHLLRKVKTICSDSGFPRDAVLRWLNVLRNGGYICTENTGRCLSIVIKKWKTLPEVGNMPYQRFEESNPRGSENPTPEKNLDGQNSSHLSQKGEENLDPNDITIKKDILNNDIDSNFNSLKELAPGVRKEQLASDLAKALDDPAGLRLYLSYAGRYPESFLRKILGVVRRIPDERIKKSRGALFNHLVQRYGQKASQNFSH